MHSVFVDEAWPENLIQSTHKYFSLLPSSKIAQTFLIKNTDARAKNRFVFKHHLLSHDSGEQSRAL